MCEEMPSPPEAFPFFRPKEKQIRQLFDVVAITHSIVSKDVAIISEFLNDRRGTHGMMVPIPFMVYNTCRE